MAELVDEKLQEISVQQEQGVQALQALKEALEGAQGVDFLTSHKAVLQSYMRKLELSQTGMSDISQRVRNLQVCTVQSVS